MRSRFKFSEQNPGQNYEPFGNHVNSLRAKRNEISRRAATCFARPSDRSTRALVSLGEKGRADVSARMSGNHFTRTRPHRRNGKVKRSQTFFLPPFPSLVIPRVVFIRAPRRMTVLSPTLQSCDNDSFG